MRGGIQCSLRVHGSVSEDAKWTNQPGTQQGSEPPLQKEESMAALTAKVGLSHLVQGDHLQSTEHAWVISTGAGGPQWCACECSRADGDGDEMEMFR